MSRRSTLSRLLGVGTATALVMLGAPATAHDGGGHDDGGHGTGSDTSRHHGGGKGQDDPQGRGGAKGQANGQDGKRGSQGSGSSTGKGSAGRSSGGSPGGNNGTVKIAPDGELDDIPNNHPHVGCTFVVEWYGFDEGEDVVSEVAFAMKAPTRDVALSVDGPSRVPVGEDAASGAGRDQDATQSYTLSFDGEPHPQQGYHVKLTVRTPRSNGADVKHKVFWVQECDDDGGEGGDGGDGGDGYGAQGSGEGDGSASGSTEDGSGDQDSSSGGSSADGSGSASGEGAAAVSSGTGSGDDQGGAGAADTPEEVDAGLTGGTVTGISAAALLLLAAGAGLFWFSRRRGPAA